VISSKRFDLNSDVFGPNQNAELNFSKEGCTVTVKQAQSTPGLRLRKPLAFNKGNYELSVTAKASISGTFFLWVFDTNRKSSIGGTVHVSEKTEQLVTQFSVQDGTHIDVGILSHNQTINDFCTITSIEIRPQVFEKSLNKPLYLEPNQKALLEDTGEYWKVTANQNNSTPGCRLSLPVSPNSLHAIDVDVEVKSNTASAFLWAYSRVSGEEILPRVHLFGGGPDAKRIKKSVYLKIPENSHEVLIGILFSSSGLKNSDYFNLFSLDIEEITTLSEVVDAGYVLNLDGEEEKFEYCQHVLQREGVEVMRMSAVRGAQEPYFSDFEVYAKMPFNEEDVALGRKAIQSPGAWGYLLTMKKILKNAISQGHQSIAVFDDDIILTHDFTLKFSRFFQNLSPKWQVLMLGASQWDWTNINLSGKTNYKPNHLSNGSFAMIYNSSIFEELLKSIEQMDSPFDSKPMKSIYANSAHSCYVAWPNLVIADVEKEGIRDVRDQNTYASRFGWRMEEFPRNYKRWRSRPILLHESVPKTWPKRERLNLVMAVTTINRWNYLEEFLSSWLKTRNNSYNWTLIVADDGSSDETLENIIQYDMGFTKLVIIQNSGGGIAKQTNSILTYCDSSNHNFDLLFSSDDDIFFIKKGWDDAYYDAISKTGYEHMVHFNENWKDRLHYSKRTVAGIDLVSMTNGESCMGCFYTITPNVFKKIGGFDENEFPIRGHSHIDFTMRACRVGFNDLDTLYDIDNASNYIGIHPKEGYVTTLRRYSYKEQMILSDQNEKSRRWSLIRSDNRKFVSPPVFKFFEPEEYHLDFGKFKLLPQRIAKKHLNTKDNFSVSSVMHIIPKESKYNYLDNWSFSNGTLLFQYKSTKLWWRMPNNYSFEDTHPDLFKVAEFVLLNPLEPDILEDWVPSRTPGHRPGLAFSAGLDSTAAMELLPEQTILLYHKRAGFNSKLDHSNALRFINHLQQEQNRKVIVVESNHEIIRQLHEERSPGFMTDYACAVHAILLADHFSLDSIATGMPLENSFLWHGQKFRNFGESWFWKKHAPLFQSIGLEILQPVMGCSEIINQSIVKQAGYLDYAQSCLRSASKKPCGSCWKCFRKNSLTGNKIHISHEIHTFLNKPKLKMAASTLYSIQHLQGKSSIFDDIISQYPSVSKHIDIDVSFLEAHYEPSLELIPEKYREYVQRRLKTFVTTQGDVKQLEEFTLYQ
jgi:glycosyltransferase involved in cell wall biosynthesis